MTDFVLTVAVLKQRGTTFYELDNVATVVFLAVVIIFISVFTDVGWFILRNIFIRTSPTAKLEESILNFSSFTANFCRLWLAVLFAFYQWSYTWNLSLIILV